MHKHVYSSATLAGGLGTLSLFGELWPVQGVRATSPPQPPLAQGPGSAPENQIQPRMLKEGRQSLVGETAFENLGLGTSSGTGNLDSEDALIV